MPLFMAAGSGSGKSRFLGRLLAWQDFINGVPLVILDPHGVTIENFLDKLSRLPFTVSERMRERLWQRIRYVDMSGEQGYVVPFPLYYHQADESLYAIAQRYIDIVRKIDPHLQTASIEGLNAFKTVGANAGIILAALDCQITEAADLLRRPEAWLGRAKRQLEMDGESLERAIAFFNTYADLADGARHRQAASFLNKINQFELDPVMRAMFGPSQPGIDWAEVVARREVVLLDFQHVLDPERRQFLMMWAYQYFMNFVKKRGPGRHQPISLIVDEMAALFPMSGLVADQFAADLDEMINQIARNYSLYLTLATQELYQFGERLQKTLLSMTLIQGRTSDPDAAEMLTRRLDRYDPYKVKKYENVWMSNLFGPFVVERRPVEFTTEEQSLLASYKYQDLKKFEFLVRLPQGEGSMARNLQHISIAALDAGHFPDKALVTKAQRLLMRRDGTPIATALAEIRARRDPQQAVHGGVKAAAIPASGDAD
jgi:HEPN domain-containing protein